MTDIINTVRGLFGMDYPMGPTMKYTRPEPLPYPSAEEVAAARDYATRFGNPNERMFDGPQTINPDNQNVRYETPGTSVSTLPLSEAPRAFNRKTLFDERPHPATQKMADALYAEQIASQRSPVANLGWDADKGTFSPPGTGNPLTHGGFYSPDKDRMWADLKDPASSVHEATHRGLKMLTDMNTLPTYGREFAPNEESLVRALMLRRLGGIEKGGGKTGDAQISRAEAMVKDRPSVDDWLTKIEDAANTEIGKRTWARSGGVPW